MLVSRQRRLSSILARLENLQDPPLGVRQDSPKLAKQFGGIHMELPRHHRLAGGERVL